MTFAVFAKTHYPLKHSSNLRPKVFDISKDLKPGDIVYYCSVSDGDRKFYGKFTNYGSSTSVWAKWLTRTPGQISFGWMPLNCVHLHTGETPTDLLNI